MNRSGNGKLITSKEVIASFKTDSDFVFDEKWYFVGNPTTSKNFIIKKAYDSFRAQRGRCTDIRNIAYKDYGARNVKHLWGHREFINWYLSEILKRETWLDPVVSRNNDLGNYRIGNCILLERKENAALTTITTKKRQAAYKQSQKRRKPVEIINLSTGEVEKFASSYLASARLGKCKKYASRMITNNLEGICNGVRFKLRYI
jgi:hypothetical protein